jgi:transposase
MDNAPVHHGGRIAELCNCLNVLLVYLPPYSPDLNPIEKVFSVLKCQLKRKQLLTGTDDDPDLIKEFLPTFVDTDLMQGLSRGSGY